MQITMHIGAGKCGSSSLQSFLTRHGKLVDKNGQSHSYAVLRPSGRVYSGRMLSLAQKFTNQEYIPSIGLRQIPHSKDSVMNINNFFSRNKNNLILSNEGWIQHAAIWKSINPASPSNLTVNALMYIRPPVDWINSAWWQWGAWTKHPFDVWLKRTLRKFDWNQKVKDWKQLEFVDAVNVRILSPDIIEDFCDYLNVDISEYKDVAFNTNTSLPNEVLRFLQLNRQLRPDAHHSSIDFLLSRHLNLKGKPDWVISEKNVKKILEVTKESNLGLLAHMPENQQQAMLSDERWWNSDAYKNKIYCQPDPLPSDRFNCNELTLSLIERLKDLDHRYSRNSAILKPIAKSLNYLKMKFRVRYFESKE